MSERLKAFPGSSPRSMQPGMDLRDWFAGQAMVGSLSRMTGEELVALAESGAYHEQSLAEMMATSAYAYADAMMAARDK
jgi:hypothetical protein